MKQNSNVPAFLSKLWTLVEDSDTNEFITWSQNGQSFLVLDEQRFAKEILPKYFKHNNMASFVRQLNMYGFRKVVHVDSGIVKQERDGPVEFQHPYFIQGQDELLENIKRKVSATRPEETKVRQEDISKILNNAQKVQMKQDTIDSRLFTLKSDRLSPEIVIVEDDVEDDDASTLPDDRNSEMIGPLSPVREYISSPLMSGPLQLNNQSSLTAEDPVTMMDSILNESGVISQNINLLGKVELLDYLDSIDCTLDDFRALLSGRQFSIDRDLLVDELNSCNLSLKRLYTPLCDFYLQLETKGIETKNSEVLPGPANFNTDGVKSEKQLVQYTSYPLMAFLDGDTGGFTSEVPSAKANDIDNFLESSLDSEPTQSKLVRLEPLTEAEANEATLFYLCELAPAPLDSDMSLLDS
ncbi:hypothetical protein AB205_0051900 [Aquarana catesbeiana]|uniref:HSF-type DNA-binding domain-containing protein n=1 Tax=Aquarana catesbeiana TaxID=8400 RepID=A0A2G9RDC0_AQUCT|nr:hypothetical protein AB205_0051900 [Aquarana catesbeiana]